MTSIEDELNGRRQHGRLPQWKMSSGQAGIIIDGFCSGVSVQVVTAEWGPIPYAYAGVGGI